MNFPFSNEAFAQLVTLMCFLLTHCNFICSAKCEMINNWFVVHLQISRALILNKASDFIKEMKIKNQQHEVFYPTIT